jgi:putative phage-type endonuclease
MSAQVFASTTDMSHEDWLQARRKGIGGSDVAPICGLSKYSSPMTVYLDKIGELPPLEDNPKMKAGRMLEPLIADWFSEDTGIKIMRRNAILQHKKHPFMLANIDRWVVGQNAGLEIKNTSEYLRDEWVNEKVPTEYMLQCNHYMAVTGAERWYVAVLIGGWDFQWRLIERDDDLIQNLITVEERFWNDHVLAKVSPEVSYQDTKYINETFPESNADSYIHLLEEDYPTIQDFLKARHDVKEAQNREETAKNKIKLTMGDAETAYFQGEKMFTWKTGKKGRTFRVVGGDI